MHDLVLKLSALEDIGSARCTVSVDTIKKRCLLVGQWVRIESVTALLYCRVWPALIPAGRIQANNSISKIVKTLDSPDCDNLLCSLIPLRVPLQNAKEVILSIKLNNFGEDQEKKQLCGLGFVWKKGSDFTRTQTIRNILNGMVICDGCVISDESRCLKIEILATSPPNDDELLFTNESRILIVETSWSENISCANNEIHQISSSLQSISLEENFTKTIPGLEKAYESLFEVVVYPLLYPDLIQKLKIECPKGVLVYGPPGVGKTYLVSTIAKACNAKIISIHGSDTFGSYIGESEARLRNKFSQAMRMTLEEDNPIILFIDELEAITSRQAEIQSQSHVVAQLLTLMDGMESCGRLIVIAATNQPNAIDPALRRPGRFDREVAIDVPNEKARRKILEFQTSQMPLGSDINIGLLSSMTNGYVGADLTSLCCGAAINAVNRQINCNSNDKFNKFIYNIIMDDFMVAMSHVSPSIKHGFQVNFEETAWDDVGGLDTIKKQLKQAVEWPLQYSHTFEKLGLKPPRGILLYGPSGCSKTTLVKIIASVSGATFLSVNGAQLYSPYVGDSEKIIQSIFQRARASNPSIIFLDEIDAIVGRRSWSNSTKSGYSVQESVLSMLLNEMDGIEITTSILVVGATNRPDMLDAALLRPGRFDRLIYVPPPDFKSRKQILKIYASNMPLNEDVDLDFIAKQTDMYTGADLKNLCRESAMIALRRIRTISNVSMSDFLKALKIVKASLTAESLAYYEKLSKFGIN